MNYPTFDIDCPVCEICKECKKCVECGTLPPTQKCSLDNLEIKTLKENLDKTITNLTNTNNYYNQIITSLFSDNNNLIANQNIRIKKVNENVSSSEIQIAESNTAILSMLSDDNFRKTLLLNQNNSDGISGLFVPLEQSIIPVSIPIPTLIPTPTSTPTTPTLTPTFTPTPSNTLSL
jgi:hypothetical protein